MFFTAWALLSQLATSTTECCFSFGPSASFLLEPLVIAINSSPLAYWTPADLGGLIFKCHTFLPFILFMGFLCQEYWSGLPFPSPVDHVLSKLFTITHLSWVVLHVMAHSFIKLCKPLCHNKVMIHEGDTDLYLLNPWWVPFCGCCWFLRERCLKPWLSCKFVCKSVQFPEFLCLWNSSLRACILGLLCLYNFCGKPLNTLDQTVTSLHQV